MTAPLIGITGNIFAAKDRPSYRQKTLSVADHAMIAWIERSGGIPLVLPVTDRESVRGRYAGLISGLLLSGGYDIAPETWGGPSREWPGQPARDAFEIALLGQARALNKPVLGICRGHQLLNVALGGTLVADLPSLRPSTVPHRDHATYCQHTHAISWAPQSWLTGVFRDAPAEVNSVHHQAVDTLGTGARAVAWAPDAVVEALDVPADRWTRGVQWHPEWRHQDDLPSTRLFAQFVAACQ